jgi:lysophospholipase L1-like esterase
LVEPKRGDDTIAAVLSLFLAVAVALAGNPSVERWIGAPVAKPPRVSTTLLVTTAGFSSPASRAFVYFGAHATWTSQAGNSHKRYYAPDNVAGDEGPPWFVTFRAAGPFEILTKGMGGKYRLIVDNHPATSEPADGPPANGRGYGIRVALKGTHTIVVEMDGLFYFGGVKGTVKRSPIALGPRIMFYGDSITAGMGAAASFDSYAVLTGLRLGLADTWASGSSGTGYLIGGPGRFTLAERFKSDVARYRPQILVLAGGHNDIGHGSADQIAAVAQQLIVSCGCKTILLSPFGSGAGDVSPYAAVNAALSQVAAATGATFIDVSGWTYPTVDGTHPSEAGHAMIAKRLASLIAHT